MWQTHIDIQLPETHLGAGDCGRDVHFGESDLWCLADFEFNKYYWEHFLLWQTHIDIQLPEMHLGTGDCGRDVHFGESDVRCFEFDQNYLELINIIQNWTNVINVYFNPWS